MLRDRRKANDAGGEKKPQRKRKKVSDGTELPAKPRQTRPGGAWRAFIRERCWGCKQKKPFQRTMTELAREYRGLGPEEKQRLKKIGIAATKAARMKATASSSAFGPRGRDVARAQAKRLQRSMARLVHEVDGEIDHMGALQDIERASGSFEVTAHAASMNTRLANSVAARVLREDAEAMVAFGTQFDQQVTAQCAENAPESTQTFLAVPAESSAGWPVVLVVAGREASAGAGGRWRGPSIGYSPRDRGEVCAFGLPVPESVAKHNGALDADSGAGGGAA